MNTIIQYNNNRLMQQPKFKTKTFNYKEKNLCVTTII